MGLAKKNLRIKYQEKLLFAVLASLKHGAEDIGEWRRQGKELKG